MTTLDTTATNEGDTVSFELDLPHPPAKVWRALSEPDLLAQWLLPLVEGSMSPGASFILATQPQPGWDGRVHCRVLDMEPPTSLRYAWVVGEIDTVVSFTLAPTALGTRLSLVHTGFRADQRRNSGGARHGWRMFGARLVEVLANTA